MAPWLPALALALDLLLADPKKLPHPVMGIAFFANKLEKAARALAEHFGSPLALNIYGGLAALIVILASALAAFALISIPHIGPALSLYLAWSGLALGGLVREASFALRAVQAAGGEDERLLPLARNAVQMLVSRDSSGMDCKDLCRSLAESVSENLNDAFVAPFFWLCLFGVPGLWMYKAASTMDSMWGYKNERWRHFGMVAARTDDVLAFIPARLTVSLMAGVFFLERTARRGRAGLAPRWPGLAVLSAQARLSASPNAGWPMSAAAWLFNGRAGGPTVYGGELVQKPFLGPADGEWTTHSTRELISHARRLGLAVLCAYSLATAARAVFLG